MSFQESPPNAWGSQSQQWPMETQPLSSFAQTMLQQDQLFYATFPEAKQAALNPWARYACVPGSQYLGSAIYEHDGRGSVCAATPVPASHPPDFNFPVCLQSAVDDHYEDFQAPIQHVYGSYGEHPNEANIPIATSLTHYERVGPKEYMGDVCNNPRYMAMGSLASEDIVESHLVVPSQQPRVERGNSHHDIVVHSPRLREQSIPYTPQPTAPDDCDIAVHHSPPLHTRPISPIPFVLTGNWIIDMKAAYERGVFAPAHRPARAESSVEQVESRVVSPSRRNHKKLRQQLRAQSRSSPYLLLKKTGRPSASSLKILLPKARKAPANKKPPLACHFCRGRKIACGAPPVGSLDPTCNQCKKRSYNCVYPSGSRRGMRKKKGDTDAAFEPESEECF